MLTDLRSTARWLGVVVSFVSVVFAILTYSGFWNEWRGDNLVAEAAARFDKSYAGDASRPVRNGDKEWPYLLRLITRYSHAQLRRDKVPKVLARAQAIAAAKTDSGAEWTAPTTPIYLLYEEWPGHGDLSIDDARVVGTIEDLHNWIRNDESDFDFLVRTIILGILSLCVGIFLALPEKPKPAPEPADADFASNDRDEANSAHTSSVGTSPSHHRAAERLNTFLLSSTEDMLEIQREAKRAQRQAAQR
jgi:hypothetical protein